MEGTRMYKKITAGLFSLIFLVSASATATAQREGRVIDRDGAAQPHCILTFTGPATFTAYTNSSGYFYLEAPPQGRYKVTLKQGDREKTIQVVEIDSNGLRPSTFEIDW